MSYLTLERLTSQALETFKLTRFCSDRRNYDKETNHIDKKLQEIYFPISNMYFFIFISQISLAGTFARSHSLREVSLPF